MGALRDADEQPNAVLLSTRDERTFGALVASDGQPLVRPGCLDGVRLLGTSQLPTNQTVGTSTDCSTVLTGDWSKLVIGVRSTVSFAVLREAFAASEGSIGLMIWTRLDTAVLRAASFHLTTGVRG